jgi:predicted XRE-type DNA-binding protein
VDQPKVSALIRGKLDGFSTDRLLTFLNAPGGDRGQRQTRVVTA